MQSLQEDQTKLYFHKNSFCKNIKATEVKIIHTHLENMSTPHWHTLYICSPTKLT